MSTQRINRQAIMSRALRYGFTLRQQPGGEMDLNEHVYAFAQEVFEAGRKAERAAPDPIQCETCGGTGEIDESIGGESFSNRHATCQDCDGSGAIESIHDFRAGQWWVNALDEIWGSTSPDVTPDQKRAVAVVHNLLRHVANLGRVTVTTDESGRAVAVTRQDNEHRILSVIWEAPVTAPVRLTDKDCAIATSGSAHVRSDDMLRMARAIETAVLRANGFDIQPAKNEG